MPIKLAYVIYPGERFYDGQLVAIEDNRLVFRRETVFTDGRRELSVELKPLRQPDSIDALAAVKTVPASSTAAKSEKKPAPKPAAAARGVGVVVMCAVRSVLVNPTEVEAYVRQWESEGLLEPGLVEPDAALGADASPMAGEQRATEQVGPNGEPVVAPLVAFRADARERCSFGEQGKLKRFRHSGIVNKLARRFATT